MQVGGAGSTEFPHQPPSQESPPGSLPCPRLCWLPPAPSGRRLRPAPVGPTSLSAQGPQRGGGRTRGALAGSCCGHSGCERHACELPPSFRPVLPAITPAALVAPFSCPTALTLAQRWPGFPSAHHQELRSCLLWPTWPPWPPWPPAHSFISEPLTHSRPWDRLPPGHAPSSYRSLLLIHFLS